jgi:hypothetical protein
MSHACCTFIKPNNEPCAARPLPDSDFCLFHDPAHQDALAAGRSKGGATPRRRFRRFPRLLDHLHVAELLSELFIEALNDPQPLDTKRLQALTRLAQVILKTVGIPQDAEPLRTDRREPTGAEDCLLRLYPPLAQELETLLAANPPSTVSDQEEPARLACNDTRQPPAGSPAPQRADVSIPASLNAPMREHPNTRIPEHPNTEQVVNKAPTGAPASRDLLTAPPITAYPASAPSRRLPADPSPLIPPTQPSLKAGLHRSSNPQHPDAQQEPEQDGNRSRTGLPGTRTAPIILFAAHSSDEPGVPPGLPLANPLEDLSLHAPYPLSFCLPLADCSLHPGDTQANRAARLSVRRTRPTQGSRPSGSTL